MIIDHEYFMEKMEKEAIQKRMIGFINEMLGSEDKLVFLL
jgi:hypothetical protein